MLEKKVFLTYVRGMTVQKRCFRWGALGCLLTTCVSSLVGQTPYMVSLRASKANVRTGPGKIYPVVWILMQPSIPLKVTETFDVWRRVEDPLGSQGWVHKSLLSSQKTVFMQKRVLLYARPSFRGRPKVYLQKGVSAKLLSATKGWFYVSVQGYKGYVSRAACWESALLSA